MVNIFERGALQQDTGVIKQRWQQDGSNLVNVADVTITTGVLYTVTSGKKLYVTDIIFTCLDGSGVTGAIAIKDGSLGDLIFVGRSAVQYATYHIPLNTPLKFEDTVYISSSPEFSITLSGWEE